MQWQSIAVGHWTGGSFGLEGSWLTSLILGVVTLVLIAQQLKTFPNTEETFKTSTSQL